MTSLKSEVQIQRDSVKSKDAELAAMLSSWNQDKKALTNANETLSDVKSKAASSAEKKLKELADVKSELAKA